MSDTNSEPPPRKLTEEQELVLRAVVFCELKRIIDELFEAPLERPTKFGLTFPDSP